MYFIMPLNTLLQVTMLQFPGQCQRAEINLPSLSHWSGNNTQDLHVGLEKQQPWTAQTVICSVHLLFPTTSCFSFLLCSAPLRATQAINAPKLPNRLNLMLCVVVFLQVLEYCVDYSIEN